MNLEQIAKLSGVSRSTASRVINNDRNVSEATREQVLRVVHLMNYAPNAAARSLAAGHTHVIGLMIPTDVSALFVEPCSALIQGVLSACSRHGHSAMFWFDEPHYERRPVSQLICRGMFDGLIVIAKWVEDPVVRAVIGSGMPFVLVGRDYPDKSVSCVALDHREAAGEATAHLLRLGRSRIATLPAPRATVAGYERLQGYCDALRTHGFPIEPDLIVESDFSEAGGYAAMQRLLAHRLDAVFAANDLMALGALRALREAGGRVPEDVALAGFDDVSAAAHADPPLTTMRLPMRRAGEAAAEALIELIKSPEHKPRRVTFPAELVVRSSCGARRPGLQTPDVRQEEVIQRSKP